MDAIMANEMGEAGFGESSERRVYSDWSFRNKAYSA